MTDLTPIQLPRRPRVLALANQKGGVGKTTTAINLGTALAAIGEKVLIVDLDPQGNASTGLGVDRKSRKSSTYDVLCGDVGLGQALQETAVPGLFLAPSTLDLLGVELEIASSKDRAHRLKNAIDELVYDQRCSDLTYVLIDCPPSLSLITINAMTAADAVLVPLQCEFFALEGLSQLLKTVEQVRAGLNPRLIIQGVVLTMYDPRNNLSGQVMADVRAFPRRQGLRHRDPAQCPGLRGAVLWQAGPALRFALFGFAGLSEAGIGSDQARARPARRCLRRYSRRG